VRRLALPAALLLLAVAVLIASRLLDVAPEPDAAIEVAEVESAPAAVQLPQVQSEVQALAVPSVPEPMSTPETDPADWLGKLHDYYANLVPPHEVLVTVVDRNSEPIAEANVEAWLASGPRPSTPLSLVTDGAGTCRFKKLASNFVLQARKAGVGSSDVHSLADDAAERTMAEAKRGHRDDDELLRALGLPSEVVLELRLAGHFRGRVLSVRGEPLAGATVTFEKQQSRGRLPEPVVSDAQGRFDVEVDAPNFCYGWAKLGEARTPSSFFTAEPGETAEEDLRFPGGFVISGRVLEGEQPANANGVLVHAIHTNKGLHLSGPIGADGRFRIELPRSGEYQLFARAAGRIESAPPLVVVDDERPEAQQDVQLVTATTIRGRVVQASDAPASNFSVWAWPERDSDGRAERSEIVDPKSHPMKYVLESKDGAFELSPLSPDRLYTVVLNGWGPTAVRHVRGGTQDVVLVQRKREEYLASLFGTVTDAVTGAPVPRFHIEAPGTEAQRVDDPQGRYTLEELQVDDEWTLTFTAPGYTPFVAEPVLLRPGGERLDVRLGPPGGLVVTVLDDVGRPAPGAALGFLPVGALGLYNQLEGLDAVADAAGSAHFDGQCGEGWLIAALGDKRAGPLRVIVPSGRSDEITLRLGAIPHGRVEVETADPVAEDCARLEAVLQPSSGVGPPLRWGSVRRSAVQADGTAVFEDVPPGLYAVILRFSEDDENWRRVVVEPGETRHVRLRSP
jgi:hypothetical protein